MERGFPTRGFHIGKARQKPPIQIVIVCGFQEDVDVFFGWAIEFREKAPQGVKSRVVTVVGRGDFLGERGETTGRDTTPANMNKPLEKILRILAILLF